MNKKIIPCLEAIAAVVLLLAVKVIAPVCTGMLELTNGNKVHMKCYYTSVAFVFLSIVLIVNAVAALVRKEYAATGITVIVSGVLILTAFSNTLGIGICMKPEMACHTTAVYAKAIAFIEIILGMLSVLVGLKKEDK